MSYTLKVFLTIIYARIRTKLEQRLGSTQFGLSGGYETGEPLSAMQVYVECLGQQKDVYACFIDYERAFDTVKHEKLIELLEFSDIESRTFRL